MEIILIRHGKAEERSEGVDDARRALTAEGKEKLQKTMPSLKPLIKDPEKACIWTSPLDRAVQTAYIIADLFKIKDVETFDFISSGNFDALLAELSKTNLSETILIVGHEPFLSLWSQQFVGLTLPFKKGAAACVKIDSLSPLDTELLWFFQPNPLNRLGK